MTTVMEPQAVRARAEAVVEEIARRLADPVSVMASTEEHAPGRWQPVSLTDGYPATALLFAELSRVDSGYRPVAHRHLAMGAAVETRVHGLYHGGGALAFAVARAAHKPGDYAGLLSKSDDLLGSWVTKRLRPEWERMAEGTPGTDFSAYDVPSGVTGIGRHLLDRGAVELTRVILRYLVTLTEPVGELPGWWAAHAFDTTPGAHANSGLAHGIAGPLALLSIAWAQGVRVPAQELAAERIVEWLLKWSDFDESGRYWPSGLLADDLTARPARLHPARSGWCYGTPGLARALQLAGSAFGRPEWTNEATAALAAMMLRPGYGHGVVDAGLCHGSAGLLHLAGRVAGDADSAELRAGADRLAEQVLDAFDPDAVFGFRAGGTEDSAGFLEGAAGIALALLGWLGEPATDWDMALLAR